MHIVLVASAAERSNRVKLAYHGGINLFTTGEDSRKVQKHALIIFDKDVRVLENEERKVLFRLSISIEIKILFLSYLRDYKIKRHCRDLDNFTSNQVSEHHFGRDLPPLDF